MCGIVGIAGDVTMQQRNCFHDMLMVCQVRGRDSTGAMRITNQNSVFTEKSVGPPEYLLDTKRYDINIDSFGKAFVQRPTAADRQQPVGSGSWWDDQRHDRW